MKTMVISGACSGVGKTTLARMLLSLFADAAYVKIGHHAPVGGKPGKLYPMGTPFAWIAAEQAGREMLIIESNSILKEMTPDCCIYLDGDEEKPSAALARERADFRRHERVDCTALARAAAKLGVDGSAARKIAWLAGARPEPFTIAIMAGGRSSRMGRDKAFIEIEGRPSVARLNALVARWCDQVIVCANVQNAKSFTGVDVVVDREEGRGPLMGIAGALATSRSDLVGVIACDVPRVDPNLFPRLCSQIGDADIAVPAFGGKRPEPLLAVYRRRVLPIVETMLHDGILRVSELFKQCRTIIVSCENSGWYTNVNTPEEYDRWCLNESGVCDER